MPLANTLALVPAPARRGTFLTTYDAFISYSQAGDKLLAAALQSALQKLGKAWYQRRGLRVFRDGGSLSATANLWPSIEQALGLSRFFVLLASHEAADSKWVNREVEYWLEHNSINTLLIALTDGELHWNDRDSQFDSRDGVLLPPSLIGQLLTEPNWVDFRKYRDSATPRDAKFTELAADLAATIHGIAKEDLLSQEVRQQRRAVSLAAGNGNAPGSDRDIASVIVTLPSADPGTARRTGRSNSSRVSADSLPLSRRTNRIVWRRCRSAGSTDQHDTGQSVRTCRK
jgi:hypothetical protein